jgi:tetrahydromethanopterin S-methyltransferase subunit G
VGGQGRVAANKARILRAYLVAETFRSAHHLRRRNLLAATMEAMRESWTDDRLDDLNGKVDALRAEMKDEFAAVRTEMNDRFNKVDERFNKVDRRFERIDDRFQAMDARLLQIYQTMLWFCGIALASLIGFLATQI